MTGENTEWELEQEEFIANCMSLARQKGDYVETLPFETDLTGHVFADVICHISVSEDGRFVEVFRRTTQEIVLFIGNGIVMSFRPNFIYLINHVKQSLTSTR